MGLYDVPANELIERTAEELKRLQEIKPPSWAMFCKTGAHKEKPPVRDDWWYVRTASVLRKITILGPIGVSKLSIKYGGRKNRGFKPEMFYRGSRNIIRKILQQLEKAGLSKQDKKGTFKGRVATPKGFSLLEKVASQIMKEKGVVIPKRETKELPSGIIKEEKEEKRKKPKKERRNKEEKAKEKKIDEEKGEKEEKPKKKGRPRKKKAEDALPAEKPAAEEGKPEDKPAEAEGNKEKDTESTEEPKNENS